MAHREGRAGREPALLEKDRQEAHVTNPQQWTKGKPVPERKKRRRFILIKELKREWEGKMRARICARAIKSPTIISITAVSPWGMPVRECPWVTASTWPLKPHSYSYLNLSSVYSGGSRKTDRNILSHSFLEGPGFLLLTLYWSWVGIFRCGPVFCSSVTSLYQNRQPSPGDCHHLLQSLSPVPILPAFGSLSRRGDCFP